MKEKESRDPACTFEVNPELRFFKELDCEVPIKGGTVKISCMDGVLTTETVRS